MSTPGPFRPQLDAAVAYVGMQVDRDTVLRARAVLLNEAQRLRNDVHRRWRLWPGVGHCGTDPVSADAAAAFTERVTTLVQQCLGYCDDLEASAHALDEVARRYGWTEAEIAASFQAPS